MVGHVALNLSWRGHPAGAQALTGTCWRTQLGDSLGLCWQLADSTWGLVEAMLACTN